MVMDPVTLFDQLEKAVNDVASTHQDWLNALRLHLAGAGLQIKQDVKQTLEDNKLLTVSVDHAWRVALEEVMLLQNRTRRLAEIISLLNSNHLAEAFKEAKKYLFETKEEVDLLQLISESTTSPPEVKQKFEKANNARNGDMSHSPPTYGLSQVVEVLSAVISLVTPQPCADKFLERMDSRTLECSETKELLQSKPDTDTLELTSEGVGNLIDSWGDVVKTFIRDAEIFATSSTSKFGSPSTIGDFFCIHGSLESLYDRLTTNVGLKS
jgi:hypothetical protein